MCIEMAESKPSCSLEFFSDSRTAWIWNCVHLQFFTLIPMSYPRVSSTGSLERRARSGAVILETTSGTSKRSMLSTIAVFCKLWSCLACPIAAPTFTASTTFCTVFGGRFASCFGTLAMIVFAASSR